MVMITRKFEEGIEVIEIKGEVDASSSIELDNAMNEALKSGHSRIMIDCTKLEYISSAGLGVFMSYLEEIKKKNTSLVIYGLHPKVSHVFEILGLNQLFEIRDTRQEAEAYLA
jgi:anti-sigma B factor antagonist